MAIQLKLNAQTRTESGRNAVKQIKRAGLVPGVIYGAKDPALNIQVVERELAKLLGHASSESVLVDVRIEAGADSRNRTALIQEVQHHPVTGAILHLDLHVVAMDELMTAEVQIEPVGEAKGVKESGGILELILRSLEIECLPGDLPESIHVDVSALEIGDSLHVKDLALPAGVTALNDADLTVVAVAAPAVAEEPTTAPEAAAQPEVINEKKPDEAAGAAS
jgi:large subunit ribosomal protein L25